MELAINVARKMVIERRNAGGEDSPHWGDSSFIRCRITLYQHSHGTGLVSRPRLSYPKRERESGESCIRQLYFWNVHCQLLGQHHLHSANHYNIIMLCNTLAPYMACDICKLLVACYTNYEPQEQWKLVKNVVRPNTPPAVLMQLSPDSLSLFLGRRVWCARLGTGHRCGTQTVIGPHTK